MIIKIGDEFLYDGDRVIKVTAFSDTEVWFTVRSIKEKAPYTHSSITRSTFTYALGLKPYKKKKYNSPR